MQKSKISIVQSFSLLVFLSCTSEPRPALKSIEMAIGHANIKIGEELKEEFLSFLPRTFRYNFNLMTTDDVNFSIKNVTWDLGYGRTDFALKELSENIVFYPFAWDTECFSNSEMLTKKGKNSYSTVLFLNTSYISPSSISLFNELGIKSKNLLSSTDQEKALKLLLENKIDALIYDAFAFSPLKTKKRIFEIPDQKDIVRHSSKLFIPCRTFFYSPKIEPADYRLFSKIFLENLQRGTKIRSPIAMVKPEIFQQVMNSIDWEKDKQVRTYIRNLP